MAAMGEGSAFLAELKSALKKFSHSKDGSCRAKTRNSETSKGIERVLTLARRGSLRGPARKEAKEVLKGLTGVHVCENPKGIDNSNESPKRHYEEKAMTLPISQRHSVSESEEQSDASEPRHPGIEMRHNNVNPVALVTRSNSDVHHRPSHRKTNMADLDPMTETSTQPDILEQCSLNKSYSFRLTDPLRVAQADLYNELNTVLRKRNTQSWSTSVLELGKARAGNSVVYFGKGPKSPYSTTAPRSASPTYHSLENKSTSHNQRNMAPNAEKSELHRIPFEDNELNEKITPKEHGKRKYSFAVVENDKLVTSGTSLMPAFPKAKVDLQILANQRESIMTQKQGKTGADSFSSSDISSIDDTNMSGNVIYSQANADEQRFKLQQSFESMEHVAGMNERDNIHQGFVSMEHVAGINERDSTADRQLTGLHRQGSLIMGSPIRQNNSPSISPYNTNDHLSYSEVLDMENSERLLHRIPVKDLYDMSHTMFSEGDSYDREILDDDSELQSCTLPPMEEEDLMNEIERLDQEYFGAGGTPGLLDQTNESISVSSEGSSVTLTPSQTSIDHDHTTPEAQDNSISSQTSRSQCLPVPHHTSTFDESDNSLVKTSFEYLDSFDSLGSGHNKKPSTLVCRVVEKASLPSIEKKVEEWQNGTKTLGYIEVNSDISTGDSTNINENSRESMITSLETSHSKSVELLTGVGGGPVGGSAGSLTTVTSCDQSLINDLPKLPSITSSNDESFSFRSEENLIQYEKFKRGGSGRAHVKAKSWDNFMYGSQSSMSNIVNNGQTSVLESSQKHSKWRKPLFIKVIPTIKGRQSTGNQDAKSKSLDRFLGRSRKGGCFGSKPSLAVNGDVPFNAYATYPPPKSLLFGGSVDDDVITSLMITHSGDHIPMDDNVNNQKHIGSTVTIPEPTSFHMHGNNVGQNLINPRHHRAKSASVFDNSDYHLPSSSSFSTSNNEYNSKGDTSNPYDLVQSSHTSEDSEDLGEDRPHFARKPPDKEVQRHLVYHTWSSSAAKKAREKAAKGHQWKKSLRNIPEDDSDSSAQRPYNMTTWYSSFHLNPARKSLRARAIQKTDSVSSSDGAPPVRGFVPRHERKYSRADSIQSACTFISDTFNHSSDADAESLYQDYDDYERSLIEYVKTEDLSHLNEDIRSMYWQQFDTISISALPMQPRGFIRKFLSCFICDARRSTVKRKQSLKVQAQKNKSNSKSFLFWHERYSLGTVNCFLLDNDNFGTKGYGFGKLCLQTWQCAL